MLLGSTSIDREMNLTILIAMLKSTMLMLKKNPTMTMMITITLMFILSVMKVKFNKLILPNYNLIGIDFYM